MPAVPPVIVPAGNAFTLAACAEMIYLDKPFLERVDAIAARGLKVEIWDWTAKDLQALAARRGDGVEIVSMTGYVEGNLTTEEGVARILSTAEDSLRAAEAIDCPRLNFHGTGLGEGNLIELCRQILPLIGEIQVADVPGRAQPGTGEISYRAVAKALAAVGYRGTVAMEAFATGDGQDGSTAVSEAALDEFIATFSITASGEVTS